VRAAIGEFLAQTASPRQKQGDRKSWAHQSGQPYGGRREETCSHFQVAAPLLVDFMILATAVKSLD
jgi:hypothetical protein